MEGARLRHARVISGTCVRSKAADEEIKTAFRRLAKQLHPDLHPRDADAERRLQEVIRAYETLSDRPSRIAYDAGLANQRSLRRWRFRANAMTVVTAFALTVSVGLHWRVLSEALLPADEHPAGLAANETHATMSGKADGVTSSMQGGSPQATIEGGGTVATKSVEAQAEPLASAPDETLADGLITGSVSQQKSAQAPSPQALAAADLAGSDDRLVPANDTKSISVPVVPSQTHSGATIRNDQITETLRASPAGQAHVAFLCGEEGNDIRHAPPHRRLWCSWPDLHGSATVSSQASPESRRSRGGRYFFARRASVAGASSEGMRERRPQEWVDSVLYETSTEPFLSEPYGSLH